jgi:hypothetical protein
MMLLEEKATIVCGNTAGNQKEMAEMGVRDGVQRVLRLWWVLDGCAAHVKQRECGESGGGVAGSFLRGMLAEAWHATRFVQTTLTY